MGFKEDLQAEVGEIFRLKWTIRDGRTVPTDDSVGLGNDGVRIEATVLYADMADSTEMVMKKTETSAAEIYKSFLKATCKVIALNGGSITAFDGDRVMAVFMGDSKNTSAAKAALQINYVIKQVVQPEFRKIYTTSDYEFEFGIGVDTSKILVAKTGLRGSNDLVWVGNAANIAAKLCAFANPGRRVWITERVFENMRETSKYSGDPKRLMWEPMKWSEFGITVYGSSWWWPV